MSSELVERLLRDATCMDAWANGVGPYPETVKGVSAKHAERVRAAADALAARDAEIERLRAVICEVAEAREEEDFEALMVAIDNAKDEAILSALKEQTDEAG